MTCEWHSRPGPHAITFRRDFNFYTSKYNLIVETIPKMSREKNHMAEIVRREMGNRDELASGQVPYCGKGHGALHVT